MAYDPLHVPPEDQRIVSVESEGQDDAGNEIWIPGKTYEVTWNLWSWMVEWIGSSEYTSGYYFLFPQPLFNDFGVGFDHETTLKYFETQVSQSLFDTEALADSYAYKWPGIAWETDSVSNVHVEHYNAFPFYTDGYMEGLSTSSQTLGPAIGSSRTSPFTGPSGIDLTDELFKHLVTTQITVADQIVTGLYALTYLGITQSWEDNDDFGGARRLGPVAETARDTIIISITNDDQPFPPGTSGGFPAGRPDDYDADTFWEPPKLGNPGRWTAGFDLETLGGGRYNEQLVAVGNKKIYFSALPEVASMGYEYDLDSFFFVLSNPNIHLLVINSKYGNQKTVFTTGTTFDVEGSLLNDGSYTVRAPGSGGSGRSFDTVEAIVTENPTNGIITNVVTA